MEKYKAYDLARSFVVERQPHLLTASQSRLHELLQVYLPISEMEDDALRREFSNHSVAFLCLDTDRTSTSCEVYFDDEEEFDDRPDDIDEAHLSLVSTDYAYYGAEMDDPYLREDVIDLPTGTESEEPEQRVRENISREKVNAPLYCGIMGPADSEKLLTDVMGARELDLFTHPVRTLTPLGLLSNLTGVDPSFNRDDVYLAPVSKGFHAKNKRYRWFGWPFKSVSFKKPRSDGEPILLGSLLRKLRANVASSIGEDWLSTSAIRPLAKVHVSLGNKTVVADAWPVTEFVSVAVALPSPSGEKDVVRRFRNWSRGDLGTSERTGIQLSGDLLQIMANAPRKKSRTHVRHSDWLWKAAPEPRVNVTHQLVNKINKLIVRKTMTEEPTLLVLESWI
jgi:hypothetical protein